MKRTFLIPLLVVVLGFGLSGCGREEPPKPKEVTKDQLKDQAGKLVGSAMDYFQQQKDKLLQEFDGRMQNLNKRIAELRDEAEKATPEMKAKLQATLKQLEEKQQAVKKQLEESKGAAGQAWEDLKSNLNNSFKEMDKDLEKGKNI